VLPFNPGDHLRVHRRRYGLPYTHHAINFLDGRIVEFGGSTANKPAMGVDFGSFARFKNGDHVDVLHHDDHDPALAMRRAEWMVSCPPPRPYHGIGFNCEHVARWCATGWETESLQIRHRLFLGRSLFIGWPLGLWLSWQARTGRSVPRAAVAAVGVYSATTIWTVSAYHNEIRHFNKHIRENCSPELRRNARGE
jgi:hypothetical protein